LPGLPPFPAELIGATGQPLSLIGHRLSVHFGLWDPTGPLRTVNGGVPRRVFLNVEGIRAVRNPGLSYGVYVNPPEDDAGTADDRYVGNVSFFGIELTNDDARDHPGGGGHGGRRVAFDVTAQYLRWRAAGHWSGRGLSVSFVPAGLQSPTGEPPPDQPFHQDNPVTFGRVSLYVR
jgi:tyrosinase